MRKIIAQHAPTWVFLLVGLLTVAVYFPGLTGDYMFDDTSNLLNNKALAIQSLNTQELTSAAFSSHSGTLQRPISMLSFALNRHFFGIDPYSHKVINLIIHLLTGGGLFILGRLLLQSYRHHRNPQLSPAIVAWLPAVITGLWLVHPLNLTSVLYIVQRMTSLSALFTVLGLCLYVLGRRRMLAGAHGLPWILAGLLVFGGLATFSKENGVLLPLFMLVIEATLFRFRTAAGTTDRTIGAFFLLTLALPAVLVMVYLAINPSSFLNYSIRDFTLAERLLTEGRVLVFYLKMTLMPSIQELGLYHDDFSISRGLLDPPETLYSLLSLAGLLLLGLLLHGKRPLVSLGILWFFAGHALESTIFPLEIAHEHRNYLADYGILLALGSALVQAPLRRLAPAMQTALPVLFLLLFSYTTWLRSEQWSDNINHAIYEARHHPQSHRAVFAAGRIYARLALQGQPDTEAKAFEYLANASRLDQRGTLPEVTMVKLSFLLGRPPDPAWYEAIIHKLSNYPETPADIISLRELADCQGGTCTVPEEIMEKIFRAALQQENPQTLTVYGYYSINKRGNFNKGLELFNRVVELAPQEPQYWKNLINLLTVMHRFDEAELRLQGLMATRPNSMGASHFQVIQDEIDTARRLQAAQSATTTGSS